MLFKQNGRLRRFYPWMVLLFWCLSVGCAWATTVTHIATGKNHTLAVMSDGSLWAWGSNSSGQLGNGTQMDSHEPIKIGTGYSLVAAGHYHSLALAQDGSLWTWGSNASGQLGNGLQVNAMSPVRIGAGFVRIAAGANHSLALKSDGSLWAWGSNGQYQLGNGDTRLSSFSDSSVPVKVVGDQFVFIAAGGNNSAAIKADGSLWTWGDNDSGQLGDGTYTGFGAGGVAKQTSPGLPLKVGEGFVSVGVGSAHMVGIKTDNGLLVWGDDLAAQDRVTPTRIGEGYVFVAAGAGFSVATKADGTLWTWGINARGQLGDGKGIDLREPTQIGNGFAKAAAGSAFTQALRLDGSLATWGSNAYGEFGIPTAENISFEPLDVALGVADTALWQGQISDIRSRLQSTLVLNFQPTIRDVGRAGHAFVVAVLPTGEMLAFTPQGWTMLNLAEPPFLSSGIQMANTNLLAQVDVSGLKGLMIFVGYGLGVTPSMSLHEMVASQRFRLAYAVQ